MQTSTGKELALPSFGGVTNDKGSLLGVRRFVAAKAGLTDEDIKEKTFKEVKALAVAAGSTDEQIKSWSKDYDSGRTSFYREGSLLNGMLAADPTFRKHVRIVKNAKGVVIGANTSYRKERSANATKDQRIQQLEAEVARLRGTAAITAA